MYSELIGNYKKYRIKSLYVNILTINSLANQMRILENNMQEISLVLGQLFVPLMEKALPVVNGLTIAIKNLLVNLAGILGIKIDPNKFGQGFTEIEDSFEGITEGTEEAEKALEEYKNQLLGFDEVNKLQDVDAKATLDTEQTGGIDLTEEILAATEEYEKFWQEAFANMEDYSTQWEEYFSKFAEPIEKIFEDIKLGDFFALGEDISKPINDLQLWVQDIIEGVDWAQAGKDFGDFFQGSVIESFNIFGESGTTISDIIIALTDFLTNAIDQVEWDEVAEGFVDGLTDFFENLKIQEIVSGVGNVITSITGALNEAIGWILSNPEEMLQLFGAFISAVGELVVALLGQAFKIPVETISDLFNNLFGEEEIDVDVSNFRLNMDNIEAEYSYLDTLKDKYFALATQTNLTAKEQRELRGYKEALIKQNPEFEEILNDETLSYQEQQTAIENIIDSLKAKAKISAAQSYITAEAEKQYAALIKYEEAKANLEKYSKENGMARLFADLASAQLRLTQAQTNLENASKRGVSGQEYADLRIKVEDARAEVERLQDAYDDVNAGASGYAQTMLEQQAIIDDASAKMEWYTQVAYGVLETDSEIEEATNNVGAAFSNMKNGVETNVNAMLQKMGASGTYISRSIDLNINAPMRNIVDIARSSGATAGSEIGVRFANSLNASKKQATDSTDKFKTSISGIVENMKKTILDKFSIDSFSPLGKNVLQGIEKGVNDKAEQNKTILSIGTFAASIGSKFANILGIHSPSKVFEEFGEFTIEGFNIGLKDMFSDSYTLMENWGTNLKRNAETSLNGLTMATSGANFNTFATQEYSSSINVNNRDEIALLKQQNALLQQLLQKETAVISPDADGLFRVVQNKANNYTQQTGQPAFII